MPLGAYTRTLGKVPALVSAAGLGEATASQSCPSSQRSNQSAFTLHLQTESLKHLGPEPTHTGAPGGRSSPGTPPAR